MSGGGSKTQTVGYWYKYLQAFALSLGKLDAVLEFRAGGRTAWRGIVTQTSRIYVSALNLWGGQKKEGGLLGYMDLQMGDADQQPNDYLAAQLGSDQPSYRGKAMAIWRGGRWGAMNPYPKRAEFKVRRILQGWDNDTPWYPEKAEIVLVPELALIDDLAFPATSASLGPYAGVTINSGFSANDQLIVSKPAGLTYKAWSYWDDDNDPAALGRPWSNGFWVTDDQGATTQYWSGQDPANRYVTPEQADGAYRYDYVVLSGSTSYTFWIYDTPVSDNRGGLSLRVWKGGVVAMNPAHVLYDSLTAADMQGEPVALVNDASFRAAADVLYDEGLGVCTSYDFDESIEEFQARILNVIGASMTQSREDGQYYLDLIRPTEDPDTLPVISSDDIISLTLEPSTITEQVNQLTAEWFDVENNVARSTPPMQSRGAIHAAGQVNGETVEYPEIAAESLCMRLQARDLAAKSTPLTKVTVTTNRRGDLWKLRPGKKVRLQSAEDGVDNMIVVVGDIEYGTQRDGRLKIQGVQDVYSMPATTYVVAQPNQGQPIYSPPVPSPAQRLIEAPYVEVAANLSAADLAAFPNDAGAIMAMAIEPSGGLNYSLYSASDGVGLEDNGTGEWCPSALIVEAAGYLDTAFTLTDADRLDLVAVGSWALWDDEIVRIDALDEDALTVTLGRGCADTVPWKHESGSRIWFCGDWGSTDGLQYLDGDTVNAALLTRTTIDELPLASATALSVEMSQRWFRPYPPAGLLINSESYPDEPSGDLTVEWSDRDRVMQSDQLIDVTAASVGPEAGTTYDLELWDRDTETLYYAATGVSSPVTVLDADVPYLARLEVWAVRDGLRSWQAAANEFTSGELPDGDPYWESVVSLLHFDNDIVDEAGLMWTGSPSYSDSPVPVFGKELSSPLGSPSVISTTLGSRWDGVSQFTIEAFVTQSAPTTTSNQFPGIISKRTEGTTTDDFSLIVAHTIGGALSFSCTDTAGVRRSFSTSTALSIGVRTHVAVTADGSFLRIFVGGAMVLETAFSATLRNNSYPVYVGRTGTATNLNWVGKIDELRITRDVSRYTEPFTPPSAPFQNY
jgi:hypothetical protein